MITQILLMLASMIAGASLLTAVMMVRRVWRLEQIHEEEHAEPQAGTPTMILFDPERGYRAICTACSTVLGQWEGSDSGLTPQQALERAEQVADFHLWGSH